MFKCFLFRKYEGDHASYLKTVLCQATLDHSYIGLTPWSLLRVIRGHMRSNTFFASNVWWSRDRAVGLVPMCFFRRDASTDMQHDLSGLPRDLTWPWHEVKFWYYFFRSTCIYFDASRRDEHDGIRTILLSQFKSCSRKRLFVKSVFFTFLDLCSLTRWR